MNLEQQKNMLKKIASELKEVGIPVTGYYMPSETTDGGLEIDRQYVLQVAHYHNPPLILDVIESPGNEIAAFTEVNDLIKFIMET